MLAGSRGRVHGLPSQCDRPSTSRAAGARRAPRAFPRGATGGMVFPRPSRDEALDRQPETGAGTSRSGVTAGWSC